MIWGYLEKLIWLLVSRIPHEISVSKRSGSDHDLWTVDPKFPLYKKQNSWHRSDNGSHTSLEYLDRITTRSFFPRGKLYNSTFFDSEYLVQYSSQRNSEICIRINFFTSLHYSPNYFTILTWRIRAKVVSSSVT
jgi:hypothetical protein